MATRKDLHLKEDVTRGAEDEQGYPGIDSRNNSYTNEEVLNESDTIKNANAAGLGSIGRNDQKQTGYTSNHSGDERGE